jgi:hypothetical protein
MNWLTTLVRLIQSTTCPPLQPRANLMQNTISNSSSVTPSIRCHRNVCLFRSNQSVVSDTCLANRVLASCCPAVDFHYDFNISAFSHHVIICTHRLIYYNGFYQRFARQQLCKHLTTRHATMEEHVFSMR